MPPLSTYPSTPPASGPHNPTTLPAGVYNTPPPVDEAIHSMEHAGAIVWYAPNAPSAVIDQIKAFYSQTANVGQSKVIVAPYDYRRKGPRASYPRVRRWRSSHGTGSDLHAAEPGRGPRFHVPVLERLRPEPYIGQAPEPNNTM